ncbi:MAG TPA: sigma-54 dependent transcriptional regulator [Thermoanaerobaculia bacterium]|nr:sigma-54 dependent transcriptional regulator [Thermoanaerobaculia bacterium]
MTTVRDQEDGGGRAEALVIEDDPLTLRALSTLVETEGFAVRRAATVTEARRELERTRPVVVLCDVVLPDGKGLEILEQLRDEPDTEVILVTGNASVDTAVEALRLGAYDYLVKPVDEGRLKTLLANLSRTRALREEVFALRHELRQLGRFGAMVGTSTAMQRVYDLIEKVAPSDASILLTGESGTGKELAAATIHALSRRRAKPFVAVNCGAVASSLIESELFGHEKGAFTGATRRHQGFFEQADGGTLLLDEIAEMPPELQVKLLRVLESGTLQRVGGSAQIGVDVRIVAASNREPEQAVEAGDLREDLFYRLNVFPIRMPPLRERDADLELLASHLLDELSKQEGREVRLSRKALDVLRLYPWPGNVRELRNVMQRAFILSDGVILPASLPPEITGDRPARNGATDALELHVGMSIAEAERRLILATLDEVGGNKKRAADVLGVSLKTLYNRLKSYRES